MNIAVIYGGRSGEHEISLISAAAITRGIKKENKVILIAITKEGKWYLQDDSEYQKILKDQNAALSIKEDEDKLMRCLFGNSFVITGNDNGYGHSERMYVREEDEHTKWGSFPRFGGLKPEFENYEIYEKGN